MPAKLFYSEINQDGFEPFNISMASVIELEETDVQGQLLGRNQIGRYSCEG